MFNQKASFRTFGPLGLSVFFVWYLLLVTPFVAHAQLSPCSCTNCPQFMPDGFTGNFYIQIQNAANPTLGQNGQGVCGVILNFDHEYLGDLSITLTSPSGQSVQLVGPIGFFGPTDGTTWDVTFVPCGDPASPDPGFTDTWNNNQPWGLFGTYTGSYYPANGCLENFNTGPVNGQWTLTVVDGQAVDVGNFYDYEIIFCDPTGIDCFSCAANAGNLLQNDVVACEGASTLNLNLPPTYPPNVDPPPSPDYSYTYVIGGAGGVIVGYEPGPDLSAYPPGIYTVCGLSYLTSQEGEIPAPDGSLTVAQLAQQLGSSQPPFCGRVTTNCVNVTINPIPDNIEETVTICAPQCYTFYNQTYCQSGTYVRNLIQNGCPYTATLYLTVVPVPIVNLTEVICAGECAQTPGFESYCTQGLHSETFQTPDGCDSVVRLNLTVLNPVAVIVPPQPLGCGQPSLLLQGTGSSIGGGVTYQWTASNGGNIIGPTTTINTLVNAAGDYQLRVCRTAGGVQCCDSASVTVVEQVNPPPVPGAITGPLLLCEGQTDTFTIAAVPGAASYAWTVPPGVNILSGQGTTSIVASWDTLVGGDVCVSSVNNCGTSSPTCTTVSIEPAVVVALPTGDSVVCANANLTYSIPPVPNASDYQWTVTPPAIIASGQGTPNVFVQWGGLPDTAQLCVSVATNCGWVNSPCLTVHVNAIPAAPIPMGNLNGCAGGVSSYTVDSVAGATSYNWQVTGGVISYGQGTDSIQVTWDAAATSGIVCVSAVNACGESQPACLTITIGIAPPEPLISGTLSLCAGDTATYTINPIPGATGYQWTVPSGATLISGQNTTSVNVWWSTAPGGPLCVSALSTCGAGPQNCQNIVVNAVPDAQAGQDLDTCGLNGTLQAAISIPGATGQWLQVSGPGTATFGSASSPLTNVTVSSAGTYGIQWTETNAGCSDRDTVLYTFLEIPVIGTFTVTCNATNDSFVVSFPISGGSAPYTVAGGTVVNGLFTSDPIPNSTVYTFVAVDSAGCASAPLSGAHNCNCTSNAGTMSTTVLHACEDQTVTAVHNGNAVLDGNDVFSYVLHTGSGPVLETILDQNTTGGFGLLPGMTTETTYYIAYVVGNNLNGLPDTSDICLSVAAGQPVVFHAYPVTFAGADTAVCGLSLTLSGNGTTGLWTTLDGPSGAVLNFSDPTQPQSAVAATDFGIYTLAWTRFNNGCSDTDTVLVTFNGAPVGGTPVYDCDPTNTSYTVSIPLSGGMAPYTVDNTPISGNTFVSNALPTGSAYSFVVTDANGCASAPITGSFLCNCTTDAGTVSTQQLNACPSDSVTVLVTIPAVLDGNDVFAYVLHTGSGPALGTIIAQNTTGTFGFVPGMVYGQTYYVSVVAGDDLNGLPNPNDLCFSVSAGQPVIFHALPSPNAGIDQSTCGFVQTVSPVPTPGFSGTWQQLAGPGTATISPPAGTTYTVSASALGTYTLVWTETNGFCPASDTIDLTYFEIPAIASVDETCNGTNTAYTITATVSGGQAPYTVSGIPGSFAGNVFTSAALPNFSAYSFTVTSSEGCTSAPYTGNFGCPCTTNAGTMQTGLLTFCAGETATATWNNDAVLDADDMVQFILHDQPGTAVGTVIATSNQPSFAYTAGIQPGTTYFISAVAGNNTGGSVALNDPCLSVSPGTPVVWKALPEASVSGDATLCEGSATVLTFSGTGAFPLTVLYSVNGTLDSLSISGQTTLTVAPATTTTYVLISVYDGTQPTCSNLLTGSATVTVNSPVEAGTALAPDTLCAGTQGIIALSSLLSGADPGGLWTEVSAVPSSGGAFNASAGTFNPQFQAPGTYRFRYALNAADPCPDDAVEVSVVVLAIPVADAGSDKTLDCIVDEVILGGPGTSSGPGFVYRWERSGLVVGSAPTLNTGVSGQYSLVVSNTFGCSDTDAVDVNQDDEVPFVVATATGVRCFGDKNGTIRIDSVASNFDPLQYTLNGESIGSTTVITGLEPGPYLLEAEDTRGCITVLDTVWVTEPPELTINLGADITVSLGEVVTVNLATSVPLSALDTVLWIPLVDSSGAGQLFQQWMPLASGYLSVRVIDSAGCAVNDRILVVVDANRNVYFPNAIKPDSGFNDYFTAFAGQDVVEIESLQIYDRWGERVFERFNFQPNDPYIGWNGRFNGEEVQPGVYAWFAVVTFLDGEKILYTGDVTVVR